VVEVRGAPATSLETTRPVCFDAEAGYVETPVVPRADLAPGTSLDGPVIVEEFGSTVPIHPGFEVRVDQYLNLIVTRVEEDDQ
jgi:N-methylhydantoinase A